MHEAYILSLFKAEYAFLCSTVWTKTWRLYDLVRPRPVIGIWSARHLFNLSVTPSTHHSMNSSWSTRHNITNSKSNPNPKFTKQSTLHSLFNETS